MKSGIVKQIEQNVFQRFGIGAYVHTRNIEWCYYIRSESFRPDVVATLNVPRVKVRTNAEALENVLLYLLGNAAIHTETGKITLEFKKRSAHSGQFIVTDTGIGIPEEKRANLFKPFAEVQDLTKGDSLGHPTCSLIAYKLNGTLRLDEEYKKGTRFILELHS